MTRFEAQRKLGLFGPHDYVSAAFLLLSWIGWMLFLILCVEPAPWKILVGWAAFNVFLHLVWLTILVYRALVFVLDLHSEVALMPEAAARIAAGYFEGRVREGRAGK